MSTTPLTDRTEFAPWRPGWDLDAPGEVLFDKERPQVTTTVLEPEEVAELGPRETLGFLVAQREEASAAQARELAGVAHWADLHRVGPDSLDEGGAVDPGVRSLVRHLPAEALEKDLRLAGEGAFSVAEFAVAELASLLQLSEPAARALVGEALELRERLPRLWAAVMQLDVPAWKARRIASHTICLSAEAAAEVDRQLARVAGKVSLGRALRLVDAIALTQQPEPRPADHGGRGVWLDHRLDGCTNISAVTSTPDALALDRTLDTVAAALGALGHEGSRDARRADALAALADPQFALDLTGEAPQTATRTRSVALHVHLHAAAISGFGGEALTECGAEPPRRVGRVERLGPRSEAAIRDWIAQAAPGASVTITPVVDLTAAIEVDAYEIPDRLRRQVEQRDLGCVFPWCHRAGAHDLDHIDPYRDPGSGGPPGQTATSNLGRLCRFHHRLKTLSAWAYSRAPDGSLEWVSPLGLRYRVVRGMTETLAPHQE